MLRHKTVGFAVLLLMATGAVPVAAEGATGVALTTTAEKEIEVKNEDGELERKRITAERVIPGEEVIYTISARNEGADPAENVVITDPIPEHMTYVAGSAAGMSTDVRFSIAGGESWDTADALRVIDAQGVAHRASAEDYTHIQWTFTRSLEPGEDGTVHFRATLN
jgi:uncharacterized repeat protein (TIGR01451 family)